MSYSISEVAQMMGIAPSTLRYYDKEGTKYVYAVENVDTSMVNMESFMNSWWQVRSIF